MHADAVFDIFAARRDILRSILIDKGVEALLVSHAANRYYLSGFELHDPQCNESAGMLLITARQGDHLLTDARYMDAAQRIWSGSEILIYGGQRFLQIAEFAKSLGLSAVYFEPSAMSFETHAKLSEGVRLLPAPRCVEPMRLIKDDTELEIMERSCALNHAVFERVPEFLVPGRTEAQVAWDIEKAFRELGASELAFPSIVAVGPNAALPHAIPGDTLITDNCPVLVDMGARLDDYCSDQTRTFWVGDNPPDHFKRALEQTQQAQQAALSVLEPGLTSRDAYLAARNAFAAHGVEDAFTHALGHGVGLETHEAPSLNPNSGGVLKPGMVVTVEPGLYYPEWGGVRWEHMALITEDGCRTL